jgi:hypothetical protein
MVLGGIGKMTYALKLTLKTAEKSANLFLESATQAEQAQVIQLLQSLFGSEVKKVNMTLPVMGKPVKTPDIKPSVMFDPKVEQVTAKVSRKLPLIDSTRSDIVSLGDKLQEALEPEFWKTGIKVDEDGSKRYKCRYSCPCGTKANHYVPLKTSEVNCHECDQPLQLSLAAGAVDASGVPVRDEFGNFYVAGLYV